MRDFINKIGRGGKLFALLLALAVVAVSAFRMFPVQAAADTDLYFVPASTTVVTGADFNLVATIDPNTNGVTAVEMHITYDQTRLRLDSITPSSTFDLELQSASINNTNGTASIALGVQLVDPPVTAVTSVATFAFHALATGTNSPVNFTTASLVAAQGEAGNALATRTGATVTINLPDTTPPTVTQVTPVATPTSDTTPNYTFNTTEAGTITYAGGCTSATTSATSGNNTITFSTLAQGTYGSCTIRVTDAASNQSTPLAITSFVVDTAGPTFTINDGASATTVQSDTINVTVADALAGVASRFYGFSADSTCNGSDTLSTAFTSGTNFSVAGNHTDYLCLRAVDNASNTTYQLVGQLHTDNTGPTAAAVTPVAATTRDTTPSYTFSTTEAGTITYGGGCTSATTSATSGNNTVTFSALATGTYNACTIRVTDAVGNQGNTLTVAAFVITYLSDLNGDRTVSVLDFGILHTNYGTTNSAGDINFDGTVNVLDFGILHTQYGSSI